MKILAQSNQLKSEEMAKRNDAQAKIIRDMKSALGIENTGSRQQTPMSADPSMNQGTGEFDEEADDLTEKDDNILDLKIIDGFLNQGMIDKFLSRTSGDSSHERQTLISVDFYDHKTRTTSLTHGSMPKYDSQISFLNRMNASYLNYLQA